MFNEKNEDDYIGEPDENKPVINWEERYKELIVCHMVQKTIMYYLLGIIIGLTFGSLFFRGD